MSLLGRLSRVAVHADTLFKRHPRRVAGGVTVLLTGFAAAAFGIAPLAPDAADLPRRTISEELSPEGVDAQLEALAAHELELSRSDLTRAGDTAATLLARLGADDLAAVAFLRQDAVARRLLEGRSGKMVQLRAGENGRLVELVARYPAERPEQLATHFTRLTITRDGDGFRSTLVAAPLQSQVRLSSGTIRTSLFSASDEARLPDNIAVQLAEIFATDIDFHRELRKGDSFSLVYEAPTADGEPITWNQGAGRVLAAEFVNDGKPFHALWYRDSKGRGGYFDLNGQSKRRSFLASPMEFSRVTSGFSMRFHPVLQTWRAHLGVDFGAPTGTAVRSVGDGVVDFAGWQNGYGNTVQVQHGNERSTLYAHLSRIDVKLGQRIAQGDRIGAVGATGWATGPHLHFEFRSKGRQLDPLQAAKASEAVQVEAPSRQQFQALAESYKAQLDVAQTMGSRGLGE